MVEGEQLDATERIARAAEVLRDGGLVAFPTETVYGLGVDATNEAAVARLFEVKGRPPEHPVIVHISEPADLGRWVDPVPTTAVRLGERFWPGPVTVIVPRRAGGIVDAVTGGRSTVGMRVPDHPFALDLLRRVERPIAAPSANRFGRVSPTAAADVVADLGDAVDAVLDGGPCTVGIESTIVDCAVVPPVVRRLGGVPLEEIEAVVGANVALDTDSVGAPGTMPSHYAPRATVVLTSREELPAVAERRLANGERVGVLGLGVVVPSGAADLGVQGDLTDYARLLYARLREADRCGLDTVLAVPPPPSGRGAAVTDRLRRASGTR